MSAVVQAIEEEQGKKVGRDLDEDFQMSAEEFGSVLEDCSRACESRPLTESKKQQVASPSNNIDGGDNPDL